MSQIYEACQFFRSHLDYLRETWGDEGITRRVRDSLYEALKSYEQTFTVFGIYESTGQSFQDYVMAASAAEAATACLDAGEIRIVSVIRGEHENLLPHPVCSWE